MYEFVLIIHVLITISLITLVLVQQGKGAEIGAAFGSGASNTIFGSQGSASFLTRATALLATLFFATSLTLSYIASHDAKRAAIVDAPIIEQQSSNANEKEASDIPVIEAPQSSQMSDVPAVNSDNPAADAPPSSSIPNE